METERCRRSGVGAVMSLAQLEAPRTACNRALVIGAAVAHGGLQLDVHIRTYSADYRLCTDTDFTVSTKKGGVQVICPVCSIGLDRYTRAVSSLTENSRINVAVFVVLH